MNKKLEEQVVEEAEKIIIAVSTELTKKIPNNRKDLIEHAKFLEQRRASVLTLFCLKQMKYYEAREKMRVPKDKELTDLDRNVMLQAYTAEVQSEFDIVKGLHELLSDRIDFIKVLLKDGES